ncbi:MAG: tRNA epoxyqueuosine(34) reductase QueG [Bacteroidetes bacterium]|nr:tRNA epoxyqueuosine(34) reductase QueG [Bacteroidota bacterium]MCH8523720.1 tRNA epoxyqueuosine(34) reductase QueG [Balneolales bacterium]
MTQQEKLTELVRQRAAALGFEACGFSKARRLVEEESRLETWLKESRHGSMSYMERNFDNRLDPARLVPGAKSVVSVFCSYNQPNLFRQTKNRADIPRISNYALGEDYHTVLKEKLFELYNYTEELTGSEINGRVFTDSAPVLDKAWARLSGLGWIGKNSNLLNKEMGSFFFIGEMIIDVDFEYDTPVADHCGRCTKCIDACPTQAIYEPYKVDGSKCISYLTIELREAIPQEYHSAMGQWMYGCDICQDVCPWNRKAKAGSEPRLMADASITMQDAVFWDELDLHEYRRLFKNKAIKRAKFDGIKRNIAIVNNNLSS